MRCVVRSSRLGCANASFVFRWPNTSMHYLPSRRRVLSRATPPQLQKLYLLTLASTANFYEKNGFAVVPPNDVPAVLKAELALGSVVQSFSGDGNSLVCMQASNYSVDPLG